MNLDAWPEDAWSSQHREQTLDDDAAEAVASGLPEVFCLWSVPFAPALGSHTPLVDLSGTTWVCAGPPSHDLAQKGSLRE